MCFIFLEVSQKDVGRQLVRLFCRKRIERVGGGTARDRLMTLPFSDDWCKRKGKERMNKRQEGEEENELIETPR